MSSSLSTYFQTLESSVQNRYLQKICMIDNTDPYSLDKKLLNKDIKNLPQVSYIDIYNYLILNKSAYTQNDFRAYKSLDSYRYFKCGWVREVSTKTFEDNVLVMGKVLHSQRMNETPLEAWFIAKQNGEIICAHCNCIAGLGETCSHVSALMFYVDDTVRNSDPVTVTGEKSYWLAPSTNKRVKRMVAVQDIDFSTVKSKHEIIHEAVNFHVNEESSIYEELTDEEFNKFLTEMYDNGTKASILSVTKPFCMREPENDKLEINLYKEEHATKSLEMLLQIGSSIDMTITKEDCIKVTQKTRGQADNKYWFNFRRGRITASVFKSSCRTSITNPSLSLIKKICYPKQTIFSSVATKYGCDHEKDAIESYKIIMNRTHKDFTINDVGLLLNSSYPMFGASPDGIVSCNCCGEGCLEVKCPLCAKNISVEELTTLKKMCLKKSSDTKVYLDKDHSYYYQVQMQLAISEKKFCDFVVWSPKDMYIERVILNEQFWLEESGKAKLFYHNVILPELLGKYFTRQ